MTVRNSPHPSETGLVDSHPGVPEHPGTSCAATPGRLRRLWQRGERAQSTTEFVVIFPALLILLFLMLEFGWMLKNYIVVTNAGREVARCAAVNRCRYEGAAIAPEDLALQRVRDGAAIGSGDVGSFLFSVHYVEEGTTLGQIDKGDSLVICIASPSGAVTPLRAFAAMAGIVPDPFLLKARTEMRVEVPWTGSPAIASGADSSCTPT
jgi:hypothetical protein